VNWVGGIFAAAAAVTLLRDAATLHGCRREAVGRLPEDRQRRGCLGTVRLLCFALFFLIPEAEMEWVIARG